MPPLISIPFQRPLVSWALQDSEEDGLLVEKAIRSKDLFLGPFIQECYQRVVGCLYQRSAEVPLLERLHVDFISTLDIPAHAVFNREHKNATITMGLKYFKKYKEEAFLYELTGVLMHELVHVCQNNGNGSAIHAFIEGIADYVRYSVGYPARHWPKYGTQSKKDTKWTEGYQTTGFFLVWIQEHYQHDFVYQLNMKLIENVEIQENLFLDITGKTVEELWSQYTEN